MKTVRSVCEMVIGIIILVFALWKTDYSNWIIVIASVILIILSVTCKVCFEGKYMEMPSASRRRRR